MGKHTCIIVTGMHRSGTSLLARFIHMSGYDLGPKLLGATPGNRYGHFEDVEILEFHRHILLREFGHQMWVPRPPGLTTQDERLATDIVCRREFKPEWGWKDPRTSLFLDLWDQLVPYARYLLVTRQPAMVLDSLCRRTRTEWFMFWQLNRFMKAWILYNSECYRFRANHLDRTLLIDLENVLDRPGGFVAKLAQLLGSELDPQVFEQSYDADAISRSPSRHALVFPSLQRKADELYRMMRDSADV